MNAAHELRTPLTLILAPIHDIMKSITPSDNWFDSFSRLHKNCLSLQTLVDRLLYVQKIEGGMIKLYLSESDIKEIVRRVANPFLQMAMVKKREFLVRVDTVPMHLWVDVAKIESAVQICCQMLLNILLRMDVLNWLCQRRKLTDDLIALLQCLIMGWGYLMICNSTCLVRL